jgi:predicted phosphodiesterase
MRYGLLADVHANLPALEAVLEALDAVGVDRYICAGDVIGFGPHPLECIDRVERLRPVWVAGNHELMLLGLLPTAAAPRIVRTTLEWTRTVLSSDVVARLRELPLTAEAAGGVVVAHGSLADPSRRVRTPEQVVAELAQLRQDHPRSRILVLGHTHHVMLAGTGMGQRRLTQAGGDVALDAGATYVVNPGSVGQSRGFVNRARAAVLDTATNTLRFVAVRYDTRTLAADLRRIGFPRSTYHRSPIHRLAGRVWGRARATARAVVATVAQVRADS